MDSFSAFPTKHELELTEQNIKIEESVHTKDSYSKCVCIKPWGYEFMPYENKKIAMWCLTVNKHHSTSLHCHFKKNTLLIVLSGCAKIGFIDGTFKALSTLQSLFIPKKKFHSISSFSEKSTLLEIEIFSNQLDFSDKNDLLRINDQYNRKPIGYQSSVNIVKENLESYNYFELTTETSVCVNGVTLELQKYNSCPIIKKNLYTILIQGNIFDENTLLKEGSILQHDRNYINLESILLLHVSKYDWKEDKKIIHDFEHLQILKSELSLQSKKVILTSGCFDILHVGHLNTLKKAKALGDILIVCLSSDEQIRALKGSTRPINNFEDRLNLFKTIEYVDYIVPYQEESIETEKTLGSIMKIVDPDIWVKGSDYTHEQILEKHPYLRSIQIIPLVENRSTTNIIKKINGSFKD